MLAASPLGFRWAGVGALLAAGACALIAPAMQADLDLAAHMRFCLTGGPAPAGLAASAVFGHCLACWAAVGLAGAGAALAAWPSGKRVRA